MNSKFELESYIIPNPHPSLTHPESIVHPNTMISILIFLKTFKKLKKNQYPNLSALINLIENESIIVEVHDSNVGFKNCAPYIHSYYLKTEYFYTESPPIKYSETIKFLLDKAPLWVNHAKNKYEEKIKLSNKYSYYYIFSATTTVLSLAAEFALCIARIAVNIPSLPSILVGVTALLLSIIFFVLSLNYFSKCIENDYNQINTRSLKKLNDTLNNLDLKKELIDILSNKELEDLYTINLEKNQLFLEEQEENNRAATLSYN